MGSYVGPVTGLASAGSCNECVCQRAVYLEWSAGEPLLGVNPQLPSSVAGFASLEGERVGLGERVAALGYAPVIQEYLKKGSPQCLRARLWAQVLGSEIKQQVRTVNPQLQSTDTAALAVVSIIQE